MGPSRLLAWADGRSGLDQADVSLGDRRESGRRVALAARIGAAWSVVLLLPSAGSIRPATRDAAAAPRDRGGERGGRAGDTATATSAS